MGRNLARLCLLASILCGSAFSAGTLDPASTYAFMVGFVHYGDPRVPLLEPANRADIRLKAALLDWGMPEPHLSLLQDGQAPRATIEKELVDFARQIPAGANLIVYWTGHGYRFGREAYLLAYDSVHGKEKETGIPTAEIGRLVETSLASGRVLFLIDTCHAGAFRQVARGFDGNARLQAASLTSANLGTTATLAWTFTDGLIDAFEGKPWLDGNADGRITFGEVSTYIHDLMRFESDELAGGGLSNGFDPDLALSTVPEPLQVAPESGFHDGEFVQERGGQKRVARIVDIHEGRFSLDFLGDGTGEAGASELQLPYLPNPFKVGDRVKHGQDLGTVLKVKLNFVYLHYDGESSDKDEWRPVDRVTAATTH